MDAVRRVIRHAVFENGPGESDPGSALPYPYAIEHQGKLYVVYSSNGTRRANNNSAKLDSHREAGGSAVKGSGGFKHGPHLGFDPMNNCPLANLYVSMLQRLGIESDRFGSGTMTGLELAYAPLDNECRGSLRDPTF